MQPPEAVYGRLRVSVGTALALTFLVALLFRLAVVHFLGTAPIRDLLWNDAVGWNLANGRGFTASASGYVPGIFRTPGYPGFLSLIYRLFGHSYQAAFWAQSVVDSLTAVLVTLTALRFFPQRTAILAGALYATYPYAAAFCGLLSQDTLLTFSVIVAVLVMVMAQQTPDRWSLWLWCGLAVGLAALVKNFLILLVLLPLAVIVATAEVKKKARASLLVVVGLALVVAPWVVRNYLWFHSFPPLAVGGSGTTLEILVESLDHGEDYVLQRAESSQVEPGYLDRFVDGQALITQEKSATARVLPELARRWPKYSLLIVRHMGRLWVSTHAMGYRRAVALVALLVSWGYLLPAIMGMYLLRSRARALLALYGLVALITLAYSPYTVEARYTLPARPVMMVFVAVVLAAGLERLVAGGRGAVVVDRPGESVAHGVGD